MEYYGPCRSNSDWPMGTNFQREAPFDIYSPSKRICCAKPLSKIPTPALVINRPAGREHVQKKRIIRVAGHGGYSRTQPERRLAASSIQNSTRRHAIPGSIEKMRRQLSKPVSKDNRRSFHPRPRLHTSTGKGQSKPIGNAQGLRRLRENLCSFLCKAREERDLSLAILKKASEDWGTFQRQCSKEPRNNRISSRIQELDLEKMMGDTSRQMIQSYLGFVNMVKRAKDDISQLDFDILNAEYRADRFSKSLGRARTKSSTTGSRNATREFIPFKAPKKIRRSGCQLLVSAFIVLTSVVFASVAAAVPLLIVLHSIQECFFEEYFTFALTDKTLLVTTRY